MCIFQTWDSSNALQQYINYIVSIIVSDFYTDTLKNI